MKRVYTEELKGAELDWAVAKAIGAEKIECDHDKEVISVDVGHTLYSGCWEVSRDWEQCGPLIEKYKISLEQYWLRVVAKIPAQSDHLEWHTQLGKTHMEAACRAIVASRLGDEVKVPAILW